MLFPHKGCSLSNFFFNFPTVINSLQSVNYGMSVSTFAVQIRPSCLSCFDISEEGGTSRKSPYLTSIPSTFRIKRKEKAVLVAAIVSGIDI